MTKRTPLPTNDTPYVKPNVAVSDELWGDAPATAKVVHLDTITVLTGLTNYAGEKARPGTKTIQRNAAGKLEAAAAPDAYWYRGAEHEVHNLRSLAAVLTKIGENPDNFVVRGKILPEVNREKMLRRTIPRENEPATLADVPRRWVLLDIDGDDLKPDFDPHENPARTVRWVLDKLAAAFRDVACWYQFSSSAGIKPGVRLRLGFWLDKPLTTAELKRWLTPYGFVCQSVLGAHQPIYCARPVIAPGAVDPLTGRAREGVVPGARDVLIVPEIPAGAKAEHDGGTVELPPNATLDDLVALIGDGPGELGCNTALNKVIGIYWRRFPNGAPAALEAAIRNRFAVAYWDAGLHPPAYRARHLTGLKAFIANIKNAEWTKLRSGFPAQDIGERPESKPAGDAGSTTQEDPGGDKKPGEDKKPTLIQSSSAFTSNFTPPDYLIEGLLSRRFVYSFTARTGAGKTAIALLLAVLVALARALGGREIERGRVLYFAGENAVDVKMRWIAMADHLKFDRHAIDVHFIEGVVKLSLKQVADTIKREAEALGGVDFVVVDTCAAYFEGDDDNNNVQMLEHAKRMRELCKLPGEPCVLVISHPVKDASPDNLLPRGGGAFLNEMDGNLTAMLDDKTTTIHWQGKFRGADFDPMAFQICEVTTPELIDSKGRAIRTVIAKPIDAKQQAALETAARSDEDCVLVVLRDYPRPLRFRDRRMPGLAERDG